MQRTRLSVSQRTRPTETVGPAGRIATIDVPRELHAWSRHTIQEAFKLFKGLENNVTDPQ
jgi:hypothetical protein